MSAFVVSTDHINYLLNAALYLSSNSLSWYFDGARRDFKEKSPTEVGIILINENIMSVKYRYSEKNSDNLPGICDDHFKFKFELKPKPVNPVAVLKAINCYRYQSCKHPEWEKSDAKAFTDTLFGLAIRSLPGYSEAAWEVDA